MYDENMRQITPIAIDYFTLLMLQQALSKSDDEYLVGEIAVEIEGQFFYFYDKNLHSLPEKIKDFYALRPLFRLKKDDKFDDLLKVIKWLF